MRLINVKTNKLEFFPDDRSTPPYAILSHMWTDKEVIYEDYVGIQKPAENLDFGKIDGACQQARKDSLDYVWIDTVCIDKRSSAELAEAINSMFRWYENSSVCYVYMNDIADVAVASKATESGLNESPANVSLKDSRWFTRGFTLQELLAPKQLVFYSHEWTMIGGFAKADATMTNSSEPISDVSLELDRDRNIAKDIVDVTCISHDVLMHRVPLQRIGIATKMSWAAKRKTKRLEDEAYCLLGIFGINMPMLYGEGQNAFTRLQEEIIKSSTDQTIFAWRGPECQLFAPSPFSFAKSGSIVPRVRSGGGDTYEMTNAGLNISLPLIRQDGYGYRPCCLAILDCVDLNRECDRVCLRLAGTPFGVSARRSRALSLRRVKSQRFEMDFRPGHDLVFFRSEVTTRPEGLLSGGQPQRMLIARHHNVASKHAAHRVQVQANFDLTCECYPKPQWDIYTTSMTSPHGQTVPRIVHFFKSGSRGNGALFAFTFTPEHFDPSATYLLMRHKGNRTEEKVDKLIGLMQNGNTTSSNFRIIGLPINMSIKISWSTKVKVLFEGPPTHSAGGEWCISLGPEHTMLWFVVTFGGTLSLSPVEMCWDYVVSKGSESILPEGWHLAINNGIDNVRNMLRRWP